METNSLRRPEMISNPNSNPNFAQSVFGGSSYSSYGRIEIGEPVSPNRWRQNQEIDTVNRC